MAIVDSNVLSIGTYLKNKKLEVPHFQRPYKWTIKNVVQLIDDIHRFKSNNSYRIGTVVIHREEKTEMEQIVDGQQRTITFLIILKAIIHRKKDALNEQLKKQISEIEEHLFAPTFKADISKINIQKNYHTVIRKLDVIDESFIDFFLNKCQITYFVINDISEAFQFFDSQNARGRDLEPHDLLKAFHLRELHANQTIMNEGDVTRLVKKWEDMDSKELAKLFAELLFRVRGWSKGDSARYFTKNNTDMFKGITLESIMPYPYTTIYRNIDEYLKIKSIELTSLQFPFQLDQTIINGKHFFDMISHYKELYDGIYKQLDNLTPLSQEIINTLNTYNGRNRTGDKYVKMLFDCALLFYIDKFGLVDVSKAIEKIFIWAYRLRLTYQNIQLVSVDNYVVQEHNLFKKIKDAKFAKELDLIEMPLLDSDSDKAKEIKDLFVKMNYYVIN